MAEKHHTCVMKFVITDKSPISCKTGIVPIIDPDVMYMISSSATLIREAVNK